MHTRRWIWGGLTAAAVLGPVIATATEITNYSGVTAQRLTNPEPGNWMLYRRTYDGQGYSPLDKVNTANVKNLVPVWTFSTGVTEGHEAPPIVNNGIMFVATPQNQVIALDAKTGDQIWRYKRHFRKTCSSCIRQVAVSDCGKTSSISRPRMTISWRSMPRPVKPSGTRKSKTTSKANI